MRSEFNAVRDLLTAFPDIGTKHEAVRQLAHDLRQVRERNTASMWKTLIHEVIRPHPIMHLLHQDPMAYRCFHKPRGYAGDAVLLDLIYGHPHAGPLISKTTQDGRAIFAHTFACPGPQAVRNRKAILTKALMQAAADYRNCSVLSVACGHLRELDDCDPAAFSRFVGFDQDEQSLSEVRARFPMAELHAANVKRLLCPPEAWHGSFDFVYAAGLYDYLSDRFAQRLTASLLTLLRPGGRLLVANFLTGIEDTGYLEAVMDWWLIYRTTPEIEAFTRVCTSGDIASTTLFVEPNNNIAFLEVRRC